MDRPNEMNFEAPLTSLVWITSIVSIASDVPDFVLHRFRRWDGDGTQWWKLSTIISCGTLAGALIPELVKVFTSIESRHVKEVVDFGGGRRSVAGILSGFVAGNFSGYYLGLAMMMLMAIAYYMSTMGLAVAAGMLAPAVFAFGLVAFGFLGMGPVTIAVDSYGPVTDNAQSVYELSLIEAVPNVQAEIKKDFNIDVNFERAKHLLEANDGAGNTFKATAKPVLIGTAVVGATTMIFSIIMALTNGLTDRMWANSLCCMLLSSWADHRRSDDLLVYGRIDAGRDYRRLSGSRVHQGQHQARGRGEGFGRRQQEGGRDLHAVCAERHVEHLHCGVLRDAGICFRRSVLLRRLPDLDRDLRLVPGHLHGQCRRRMGQRQEDCGSRS